MKFEGFPKIPRLNSTDWILTEKLDGTNAQVFIEKVPFGTSLERIDQGNPPVATVFNNDDIGSDGLPDTEFLLHAGSRNRWLTPDADNFGFAQWVKDNAGELTKLGPGRHYGEWYGSGIQRGYGLSEKRFALFNTKRWVDATVRPKCCEVVPILNIVQGSQLNSQVEYYLDGLRRLGSYHVPFYNKPEGIVIFHPASGSLFKALCVNDNEPKSLTRKSVTLVA